MHGTSRLVKNVHPASFWHHVIFSDEKRFCLDGPDGSRYYWADPRMKKEYFAKRPNGGGGVMVWARISACGKTALVFVEGNMDSNKYVEILMDNLMPLIEEKYTSNDDEGWFQQDHASCHTSKFTRDYFMEESINKLPWAVKSPVFNVIENAWGILVRRVFYGDRQFETIEDLKETLRMEWEKLEISTILSLVNSMPSRCAEAIINRSGPNRY